LLEEEDDNFFAETLSDISRDRISDENEQEDKRSSQKSCTSIDGLEIGI